MGIDNTVQGAPRPGNSMSDPMHGLPCLKEKMIMPSVLQTSKLQS